MTSVLEVATGVHARVADAVDEVRSIRASLRTAAAERGALIAAAGTHPFSRWEHQEITDTPRYQGVVEALRWVAEQVAIFGLHVHVAVPSADVAMKVVSDPQLSPDGKWVAYAVTEYSLKENRGTGRIWLAELETGQTRRVTEGPGSDRQPRWSPDGRTLGFVSTRQNGPQLWVLPIAGGEARRVTNLGDGVSDPVWLPDGKGLLVTSDIKWPADQEIDRRNGDYPTDARIWTDLLWRHWDDWRAGKRQHLFLVTLAGNAAKDITPFDHDVPTIATSGETASWMSRSDLPRQAYTPVDRSDATRRARGFVSRKPAMVARSNGSLSKMTPRKTETTGLT